MTVENGPCLNFLSMNFLLSRQWDCDLTLTAYTLLLNHESHIEIKILQFLRFVQNHLSTYRALNFTTLKFHSSNKKGCNAIFVGRSHRGNANMRES